MTQKASSNYAAALTESINAVQNGATLTQLVNIATKHQLNDQEHANIGQSLWHATQQGLIHEKARTRPDASCAREHATNGDTK